MMKLIVSLLSAFTLIGCGSSQRITESNYLLKSPLAVETEVEIGNIKVHSADYLEDSNIQLELFNGSLRPANYHHWAQPLEIESKRYLDTLLAPTGNPQAAEIEIVIQRFHGDEGGIVKLEGKWKGGIPDDDVSEEWRFFKMSESSPVPGYPALVETHSKLLSKLGFMIVSDLKM